LPISRRPEYAVKPGMPSTPRAVVTGAAGGIKLAKRRRAVEIAGMRKGWKPRLASEIQQRVGAPSGLREDDLSPCIIGMLACDHPRDRLTDHYVANL
jgi:hypothetical protein